MLNVEEFMFRQGLRHSERRAVMLATGLLASVAASAAPDPTGRWQGVADIPGAPMRLVVDIARGGEQRWVGSVILPGRGVKGAPIADVQANDAGLRLNLASAFPGPPGPTVEARLDWRADGALSGEFRQGGHAAPLLLRRTGPPQVDLPTPGTPVSPSLEGTWTGRYELDGFPRDVTLKLVNNAGGAATGELVIVGRRTSTLAVDHVRQGSEFIELKASAADFRIEGRWSANEGSIRGQMLQGPFEAPLVLRKSDSATGSKS
jgi:hypothetical protein